MSDPGVVRPKSPFRPGALERYYRAQDRGVLPSPVPGRLFGLLWLFLALLGTAFLVVWLMLAMVRGMGAGG